MTAERLAVGLAAAARCRREELLALGERLAAAGDVELLVAPRPETVMAELEGPLGAFCLGEVIVTTCTLRAQHRDGWACVLGFDREGALAGALADACGEAAAATLAEKALATEGEARAAEEAAIGATRVRLA